MGFSDEKEITMLNEKEVEVSRVAGEEHHQWALLEDAL